MIETVFVEIDHDVISRHAVGHTHWYVETQNTVTSQ